MSESKGRIVDIEVLTSIGGEQIKLSFTLTGKESSDLVQFDHAARMILQNLKDE